MESGPTDSATAAPQTATVVVVAGPPVVAVATTAAAATTEGSGGGDVPRVVKFASLPPAEAEVPVNAQDDLCCMSPTRSGGGGGASQTAPSWFTDAPVFRAVNVMDFYVPGSIHRTFDFSGFHGGAPDLSHLCFACTARRYKSRVFRIGKYDHAAEKTNPDLAQKCVNVRVSVRNPQNVFDMPESPAEFATMLDLLHNNAQKTNKPVRTLVILVTTDNLTEQVQANITALLLHTIAHSVENLFVISEVPHDMLRLSFGCFDNIQNLFVQAYGMSVNSWPKSRPVNFTLDCYNIELPRTPDGKYVDLPTMPTQRYEYFLRGSGKEPGEASGWLMYVSNISRLNEQLKGYDIRVRMDLPRDIRIILVRVNHTVRDLFLLSSGIFQKRVDDIDKYRPSVIKSLKVHLRTWDEAADVEVDTLLYNNGDKSSAWVAGMSAGRTAAAAASHRM